MDIEKIGKAIKELRQRAGYTQAQLAECLDVTDKAVSRWERCLGVPDISLLAKLCNLLNTDMDNLLEGNISYLEHSWKGVLILSENESGITPDTKIYGKCFVYIPMSYFILAGIKDITVVGNKEYVESAERVLGNGSKFGISVSYSCDEEEAFYDKRSAMVVYSDVFLYGPNLTRYFQRAIADGKGMTYLAIPESKEDDRIYFDHSHIVKKHCQMAVEYNRIPILFYKESYIHCLNDEKKESIIKTAEPLGRGMIYRKIRTWKDVNDVSNFIEFVENNTGDRVYCLEEVACNRGMISKV